MHSGLSLLILCPCLALAPSLSPLVTTCLASVSASLDSFPLIFPFLWAPFSLRAVTDLPITIVCVCVCVCEWLSRVRYFATPWTVTCQAPLSMKFSRQEYWSGLPLPSPGDLPDPEIEPGSPALQADALPSSELSSVYYLLSLVICHHPYHTFVTLFPTWEDYFLPGFWLLQKWEKKNFLNNLRELWEWG